jgi:hypothetical protein
MNLAVPAWATFTKAYEEIRSGRLRARKNGKRTIIIEDDAEDWLQHLPIFEVAR